MARKRKHHEDPDTEVETPEEEGTETSGEEETSEIPSVTPGPPGSSPSPPTPPVDNEHVSEGTERFDETPPNPDLARPSGDVLAEHAQADREHASYHPNEELGKTAGDRLPTSSAPLLDEDTHDFGPTGGEERCRKCGKTREELSLKIGKPLTVEELEHPDVKDGPLLPPRIR